MNDARDFLPHDPPAIMLQTFETWESNGREGLKGRVRLDDCNLLWMTAEGLPVSFSIEILGQLSAVFLRRMDADVTLLGGRLATVDLFRPVVSFLPSAEEVEARLVHLGGSSAGYHKFSGELLDATGAVLAEVLFSVVAFLKE